VFLKNCYSYLPERREKRSILEKKDRQCDKWKSKEDRAKVPDS
jgi:hypothetical protein